MATKTTALILQRAREIITPREAWATRNMAYDSEGHAINPEEPEACKFCSVGAVRRAAYELDATPEERTVAIIALRNGLEEVLAPNYEHIGVISFNDTLGRQHSEVLAVFDNAIKKTEK